MSKTFSLQVPQVVEDFVEVLRAHLGAYRRADRRCAVSGYQVDGYVR